MTESIADIAHKMDLHATDLRAVSDNILDLGRRLQGLEPGSPALENIGMRAAEIRLSARKLGEITARLGAADPGDRT